MKIYKVSCALIVIAIIVSGCTMAKISGKGAIPIMLNQPQAKIEVIRNLIISKMIMFDYTNTFDISEILSGEIGSGEGDAIINCTITIKNTPKDFLVNLFTWGIAAAKTIEISGQLVTAPNGLGLLDNYNNDTFVNLEDINNNIELFGKSDKIVILLK